MEKIYNRFTKSKKEVTTQDLQKEIKDTKSEVRTLRQELTILRVDHNLMDQRVKQLEHTSYQGNEEGTSLQNPSDEEVDETVNPTADMIEEPFVLVKNMTDRVILGNPFMCLLYPFVTNSEGITTHPFGQPVKFKFLRSPEPREISSLQEVSVSKTLSLISAKT